MSKQTIKLNHEKVDYVNTDGNAASADFREVDAKEAFLDAQSENGKREVSDKVVRVYRQSRLGKTLLARFRSSSATQDASEFAEVMNENYAVLGGFYTAIVK